MKDLLGKESSLKKRDRDRKRGMSSLGLYLCMYLYVAVADDALLGATADTSQS